MKKLGQLTAVLLLLTSPVLCADNMTARSSGLESLNNLMNPMNNLMNPIKSVADHFTKSDKNDEDPGRTLLEFFVPRQLLPTTTPAPTTTEATLINLKSLNTLPGADLLNGPAKIVNKIFADSKAGPLSPMTVTLKEATKVISTLAGPPRAPEAEDDRAYYEYNPDNEPNKYRDPKYFSKECRFRSACEIGQKLRLLSRPFHGFIKQDPVIQDLQNRYTRAITYGMLHNNCERYYCLITQLVSGPTSFVTGMAEFMNRVANPNLYAK